MSKKRRLNVQGMARKDKDFQSCLVADKDKVIVSVDLSAGEPTVTAHYSGDKNYTDASFGMVGKEPYYENGYLKIDNIYLTASSFSPLGRQKVREAFERTYDGVSFAETWLRSPNKIKSSLKDIIALHKILVLGIGYSMGPKKMVKSAYDKGYHLTLKDAKEFYNNYWAWCPKVRKLSDDLTTKFNRDGYLVNDFGFRLVPDSDYKALNYWIQSSVSGVINALWLKFAALAPYAEFITIIHDELLFTVNRLDVVRAKEAMTQALESLNNDLGWSVKVRTGWVVGNNFAEAK